MPAVLEPGTRSEAQDQGSTLTEAPLLVAVLPNLLAAGLQWLGWIPIPSCLAGILLAMYVLASLACTLYRHGPPSMRSLQNC